MSNIPSPKVDQKSRSLFSIIARTGIKVLLVVVVLLHVTAADARRVTVGVPVLDVTQSALYVPKDRGYFQKEGLEVDLILMRGVWPIKR